MVPDLWTISSWISQVSCNSFLSTSMSELLNKNSVSSLKSTWFSWWRSSMLVSGLWFIRFCLASTSQDRSIYRLEYFWNMTLRMWVWMWGCIPLSSLERPPKWAHTVIIFGYLVRMESQTFKCWTLLNVALGLFILSKKEW